MQRTRWLLIGVLVLASAGCARRDWVSDLLVLTDVTGTWKGSVKFPGTVTRIGSGGPEISSDITMALQQRGPKVTGELWWSGGRGQVEGVVTGEVLSFSEGIRAELTVDGDEMTGTVYWAQLFGDRIFFGAWVCDPCHLHFRRESARVPSLSEPPARQGP